MTLLTCDTNKEKTSGTSRTAPGRAGRHHRAVAMSRGPGGRGSGGARRLCHTCQTVSDSVCATVIRFTIGFSIEEFRICFMTAPCAPHPTWLPCSCVGSLRSRSLGPRRAAVERRAAARAGQRRGLSRGVGVGAAAHITTQHTCAAYTAVVHIPLVSRSSRSQPFTAIHNSSHPARLGHLSAPSRSGRLQAGSSSAPCLDILQWRGGRGGGEG